MHSDIANSRCVPECASWCARTQGTILLIAYLICAFLGVKKLSLFSGPCVRASVPENIGFNKHHNASVCVCDNMFIMDGWMYGWKNGWLDACMDGWMPCLAFSF